MLVEFREGATGYRPTEPLVAQGFPTFSINRMLAARYPTDFSTDGTLGPRRSCPDRDCRALLLVMATRIGEICTPSYPSYLPQTITYLHPHPRTGLASHTRMLSPEPRCMLQMIMNNESPTPMHRLACNVIDAATSPRCELLHIFPCKAKDVVRACGAEQGGKIRHEARSERRALVAGCLLRVLPTCPAVWHGIRKSHRAPQWCNPGNCPGSMTPSACLLRGIPGAPCT